MQIYRSYFTCSLALVLLLSFASIASAQSLQTTDNEPFWEDSPEMERAPLDSRNFNPQKSRLLKLNPNSFLSELEKNKKINTGFTTYEILLPLPDGTHERFSIWESSMMESGLETKYSGLKTYTGKSLKHPDWTVKLDLTSKGFHGMILGPNFTAYIDPYAQNFTNQYVTYYRADYQKQEAYLELDPFEISEEKPLFSGAAIIESDGNLRSYRLAVAATGEYTAFHGGTVNDGMSAIITVMNRVNGIYEREFGVTMVLVNNNDLLVYVDDTTDPFSNNNTNTLINQSQTTIDAIIGVANYDIGHTFSTGAGGLAGLGVVCFDGYKAKGVTGISSPVGDAFAIDYVAHEIGHQFGAHHTFNGNGGSCGGNRNASTAFEPGSGSTIMAYAGICSGQNLQNKSDAYFHSGSLDQVIVYTTIGWGGSCPTMTSTGNNPPTVDAGLDYIIPKSTPFTLEGSGNDPDGDALTYTWEQIDLGTASAPDDPDNPDGPIFRSFAPNSEPIRTFPKLSDILSNSQTTGEVLPNVGRALTFQLTVRDNHASGGRIGVDTAVLTVRQQAGPFIITGPNTANINWAGGSSQNVTWNPAGTDTNPINCSQVDIFLSEDGGLTFPHVLVSGTANDGNVLVQVPNVNTNSARIKVQAVGNIFFDISDRNFTINQNITVPSLNNPIFNSVTANEAVMGADLISDGGATVTERGIVWSEQANPIVGNGGTFKIVEGNTNLGSFTVNENNLPSGKTIHFRGYAINSQGVGYTQNESFQTELGKPLVKFQKQNYTVSEAQGTGNGCERIYDVNIPVEITDAPSAAVNIGVILGGTATQVQDFELLSPNPIIFNAGVSDSKIIRIRIYDDAETENQEELTIELVSPDTNLAVTGGIARLKINDDDLAPDLNTDIASDPSVSISQKIGPLQTVHFYDEISGKLMASIQNHANYDFGCTWVEIDRSGNGVVPFWEITPDNAHDLMEKTFFIHTENNQPTNAYTVTLYYTQDEVDGWLNATGGIYNWDSLQMAQSPGKIENISPTNPEPDGKVVISEVRNEGGVGKGYGVSAEFSSSMGGLGVGKIGVQGNFVNFIELTGFYNQLDKKVDLEWKTNGEINVVSFDLERISPTGEVKELKEGISAAGMSNQTETYSFRDKYEPDPFVDYLVKANFEDGSFAYSDTLRVEIKEMVTNVFPNPFTEKLNIYVEGEGEAIVTITSATLSLLNRYSWDLTESATVELDLDRLAPGLYFYSIVNQGRIKGGTLVKYKR